jgi:hypothetical protein
MKGERRSALQLYASPTGSQTLLRDWPDAPVASAPLGLKSIDDGHEHRRSVTPHPAQLVQAGRFLSQRV